MIALLKIFLIISITFLFVKKICNFNNLIKVLKIYLEALKNLNKSLNKKNSLDNIQKELNNVSSNGLRLLIKLILFILPYIFCSLILNYFIIDIPFKINIIISFIPYLILIKKNE